MINYSFVTIWKIEAPLEAIWQEIKKPEHWPEWWKGVLSCDVIEPGDDDGVGHIADLVWKSALPYKLLFRAETMRVDKPKQIEVRAEGELTGRGLWTFSTDGPVTTVRYDWNVTTSKRWMNALSAILKPAFEWNHDVIMTWGGQGLAKRVNGKLISHSNS